MIKKSIVVFVLAVVLVAGFTLSGKFIDENDEIEGEAVGFAYADGENAFSIYVSEPNWTYYKFDDGTVMFYDTMKNDGITGFAISSNSYGSTDITESKAKETIEALWEQASAYFEQYTSYFEWYENEDCSFGGYTASRYSYEAVFDDAEGTVLCDYLFWSYGKRIYICSFGAYPQDYDEYFAIMEASLENFIPIEE